MLIPDNHESGSATAGPNITTRHQTPGRDESESIRTVLNITTRHHVSGYFGNNSEPLSLNERRFMPCRYGSHYGAPCRRPLLSGDAGVHAGAKISGGFNLDTPLFSLGAGGGLGIGGGLGGSASLG